MHWLEEWQSLCEAIRDAAEGYAATDVSHGWLYREEAAEFCRQAGPANLEAMSQLENEANGLKTRWSNRLGGSNSKP